MLTLLLFASLQAHVTRVVDGDTLRVAEITESVRVLGIDCPESKHNAKCRKAGVANCAAEVRRGKAATARAKELLRAGDAITLESADRHDRHHRLLAYVRLKDGTDYGLAMLKAGLCADYGWKYPHLRGIEYSPVVSKTVIPEHVGDGMVDVKF